MADFSTLECTGDLGQFLCRDWSENVESLKTPSVQRTLEVVLVLVTGGDRGAFCSLYSFPREDV